MLKRSSALLAGALSVACFAGEIPRADPIQQLLDERVRAPEWRQFVKLSVPADDAPSNILLLYWMEYHRYSSPDSAKPSARVSERLLEAAEKLPEVLGELLELIPNTPAAHERVKKIYDAQPDPKPDPYWRAQVRNWLMLNSRHFRSELIAAAKEAELHKGEWFSDEALKALARLDWPQTAAVLTELAARPDPALKFLALVYQYEHAAQAKSPEAAGLRAKLIAIAEDRKASAPLRDRAIESLMGTVWEQRDAWFASLFKDSSLVNLEQNNCVYAPLRNVVRDAPERWIPELVKWAGSPERAVQDNAVSCLTSVDFKHVDPDVIRPLIPRLSNPNWPSAKNRGELISKLEAFNLPESVPGWLWVLEHDAGYGSVALAARELAKYKLERTRAVPLLKQALQHEAEEYRRRDVAQALIAYVGFSIEESMAALEACATQTSTPQGTEELDKLRRDDKVPLQVSIGGFLCAYESDELARAVLARAKEIQQAKPAVAAKLLSIVGYWDVKTIDWMLLSKLGNGDVDAGSIQALLWRRARLQQSASQDLATFQRMPGKVGGIAAALDDDPGVHASILRSDDGEAQRALLACARLLRMPLPLEFVKPLLKSGDPGVTLAAERYLYTENSTAAREALAEHTPQKYQIFGAYYDFGPNPDKQTHGDLAKWEKRLSLEMSAPNAPDEIFALLTCIGIRRDEAIVVRVRGESAVVERYKDEDNSVSRPLTAEELKTLRSFAKAGHIDELPPLHTGVCDGTQVMYEHFTKKYGCRVYMNNPGADGSAASIYHQVSSFFFGAAPGGR